MTIAFTDVFPILASALPGFQADKEDWKESASYFFLSDMVRFVCQRTSPWSIDEADQFAALMEQLATEGDEETQYLVIDALESLWEHEEREIVATRFGPETNQLWIELLQRLGDGKLKS
jgi:hypothetical protein